MIKGLEEPRLAGLARSHRCSLVLLRVEEATAPTQHILLLVRAGGEARPGERRAEGRILSLDCQVAESDDAVAA